MIFPKSSIFDLKKLFTLTCAIAGCRGDDAVPLNTKPGDTYCESCVIETCEETCDWTCFETCLYTCQDACSETCGQKVTCEFGFTCNWPTCNWLTCMGC